MKYTNIKTLTVGQYQELYSVHKENKDQVDKSVQLVSILTGLSEAGVDEMTVPDYNKACKELAHIFGEPAFKSLRGAKPKPYIRIGGKRYGIIYKPSTITAGQYASIQTWMAGDVIENMHLIMASLVYPVKGVWPFIYRGKMPVELHQKVSEQIKDCNFLAVHAACVFFSKVWTSSIKALVPYLEKEMKRTSPERVSQLRKVLQAVGDGFTTQSG